MGPATEEAIRPEANERKRKKNRRRRTAPIRPEDDISGKGPELPDLGQRRMPSVRAAPQRTRSTLPAVFRSLARSAPCAALS